MKDILKNLFKRRIFVLITATILAVALISLSLVALTNIVVLASTKDKVISSVDATALDDVDCIVVLGCLVRANGTPSDMLTDRLLTGIELYFDGSAPVILMSGDHGQAEYDEVGAMKSFATERGVPASDVFMDHAGFSTYESMYRAKEIFGADKIIVVTQGYHLPRALYIAKALGIEAYGVSADIRSYRGQIVRDARELLARTKDFAYTVFKPEPTYLGEPISLDGDASLTDG